MAGKETIKFHPNIMHELDLLLRIYRADGYSRETMIKLLLEFCPDMPPTLAIAMVLRVQQYPNSKIYLTARKLGRLLGVTNEIRERLKLWCVLPYDMTDEQLEEQRKEKNRARSRVRRAASAAARQATRAGTGH